MILVSARLTGVKCNYKGESKPDEKLIELVKAGRAIPVGPEQLGALTIPRSGVRILSGKGEDVLDGKTRIITDNGNDVTEQYIKGAYETLKICKRFNTRSVVLKQGSPSCGNGLTQGGEERNTVDGYGVTAASLKRNGVRC